MPNLDRISEILEADDIPVDQNAVPEDSNDKSEEKLKPVSVYFADLTDEVQKKILDSMKEVSNASEDDQISEDKIREQLALKPIFTIVPDEFKRQMDISI